MALARAFTVGVVALFVSTGLAGCVELEAAHVPDAYVKNGWTKDDAASQDEPTSAAFGTTRTQTLGYRDDASDGTGYPGALTVVTLRTLVNPSEESIRDQVKELVEAYADEKGILLDDDSSEGSRSLANEATSLFFIYNGTATAQSGFFTRDAKIKVVGEVFQCRTERTVVVAVGIAQLTDTRSLGGVVFPANNDPATWRELVADPKGAVEGVRGSSGLLYNVACS